MATRQQTPVKVHQFGREREPVVVIDDFSGIADQLLAAGRAAEYREGGASYPGIRAWCEPTYLDRRRDLMFQLMQRIFGFRQRLPSRWLRSPKTSSPRSSGSRITTMRATR